MPNFKHFTIQLVIRDQPTANTAGRIAGNKKYWDARWYKKCLVCTCADSGWACRHCLLFLLCSDALACGSVPASVCFHCARVNACISSWACEYARASVPSLNAQPLPRAGVCGSKSKGVCVSVCVYTDLRAECRPKHKSGSCLCPSYRRASDYHTVLLLPHPQGHGTATGTGGQGHTRTSNPIGMRELT